MNGAAIGSDARGGSFVAGLLALALLLRLIVPAGWMPVAGDGYAITLCTGTGMVSAWVDTDGAVHKQGKAPAQQTDHPCVFAGFSMDLATPGAIALLDDGIFLAARILLRPFHAVSVGRGLAAPPPPPTGPPANL